MASSSTNYTNIADIKQHWMDVIAPNYFDFDNVNNYQTGIFGYINEVMAEATEDGFNAVNTARKEFYPVTAQYMSSFYKMAAMQKLDVPLTTPAHCKAALVIPQKEILENSTITNGVYECTIDSCLKIFADNLQFMLDYPIKIISTKTSNGTYNHTIHYDVVVKNSLSDANASTYISNKVIFDNGTNYVILFLDTIRQLECTFTSTILQKDSTINTISFDVDFEGDIANFEVFYKASQNTEKIQLAKVLKNSTYPSVPFVCYEFVNENKLRFTFPDNPTFSPGYNSEVITMIYTSKGEDGNFQSYSGDLICSSDSEDYPYNSTMTILGKVNGSALGGRNKPTDEEFRSEVIKAYSMNNTITLANDLQLYFDKQSSMVKNAKVMFRKLRDDALIRLFGAYILLKDNDNNVVPTNTVNVSFKKSDVVDLSESTSRIMIKPGTIFEYMPDSFDLTIAKDKGILSITDSSSLYFTNPFLIGINLSPNLIGYYLNSVDTTKSIQYIYVNDKTATQFISSGLSMYRNAITGTNFYEIKVTLLPATSDLDFERIVKVNDSSLPENMIIARANGEVTEKIYIYDQEKDYGYVRVTIKYEDNTTDEIQASTAVKKDGTRVTGYDVKYSVGDSFVVGDVLATKLDDDLGNLTVVGDINGTLYENGLYIPFSIEKYLDGGGVEFKAYLSTDDSIDLNYQISITHGIFNKNGEENDHLAIGMNDIQFNFCALYNNEGNNLSHKYSDFNNLTKYTLTNSYTTNPDDKLNFIETYSFIRSAVDFAPGASGNDYIIKINEMPVIQAWWANKEANYSYFINKINSINEILTDAYSALENNFSIDVKFYNTYGKARFYQVGNSTSGSQLLDSVRCKFRFGINLLGLTDTSSFIEKFRLTIKEYIENTNDITTSGQDTYILNLIAKLKNTYSELIYLEYYGFNIYDNSAQKIIGPDLEKYTENYIPEFINIGIAYTDEGEAYPDIEIKLIDL